MPVNVAVSNGAKHAIHNVLTCLCDPGDEVLIPAPYWVSYSAIVELAGARPVLLETTQYGSAQFQSLATLGEDIRSRTILINGVSKAYAMTGWWIGWTIGPQELIDSITCVQGQQTSNPCSISQHAAVAALQGLCASPRVRDCPLARSASD